MPKNSPFLGANLKVVILSILAATTFWFFNALNKNYTARISYPIEFVFNRDSVVVMNPIKDEIILDVSSGGWNLLRKTFLFKIKPIQVPLVNPVETKFISREGLLPLVLDQFGDLTLNAMVTDTIFFDIEKKISKKVKLALDSLAVPLAANHRIVSNIAIKPDSIVIIGPKVLVNKLPDHYSFDITRQNINQNFDRSVIINLPDNKKMMAQPGEAQVKFNVSEFIVDKKRVNVVLSNFPKNTKYILKDSVVEVSYQVAKDRAESITAGEFIITADFSNINRTDSIVLPSLFKFPPYITDLKILPDTLSVTYGNKASK